MMAMMIHFVRPSSWRTPKRKPGFDQVSRLLNQKFLKEFSSLCTELHLHFCFSALFVQATRSFAEDKPMIVEIVGEFSPDSQAEACASVSILAFMTMKKIKIVYYAYSDETFKLESEHGRGCGCDHEHDEIDETRTKPQPKHLN